MAPAVCHLDTQMFKGLTAWIVPKQTETTIFAIALALAYSIFLDGNFQDVARDYLPPSMHVILIVTSAVACVAVLVPTPVKGAKLAATFLYTITNIMLGFAYAAYLFDQYWNGAGATWALILAVYHMGLAVILYTLLRSHDPVFDTQMPTEHRTPLRKLVVTIGIVVVVYSYFYVMHTTPHFGHCRFRSCFSVHQSPSAYSTR